MNMNNVGADKTLISKAVVGGGGGRRDMLQMVVVQ